MVVGWHQHEVRKYPDQAHDRDDSDEQSRRKRNGERLDQDDEDGLTDEERGLGPSLSPRRQVYREWIGIYDEEREQKCDGKKSEQKNRNDDDLGDVPATVAHVAG